jgi:hypothetical protein
VARQPTRTPTSTATPTRTPSPTPVHVDFIDDFSNPASGWFVGDVDNIRYGYFDGEYEMLVRPQNTIAFVSAPIPSLSASAGYSVEADFRLQYGLGGYGLIFDRTSASDYCVLSVDLSTPGSAYYAVRRHTASGWTFVLNWVQAPAINSGAATKRLAVLLRERAVVDEHGERGSARGGSEGRVGGVELRDERGVGAVRQLLRGGDAAWDNRGDGGWVA